MCLPQGKRPATGNPLIEGGILILSSFSAELVLARFAVRFVGNRFRAAHYISKGA